MLVTVKLFASYRIGRFKEEVLEFPADARVGQIMEKLEIPDNDRGILLLNGQRVPLHHPLRDGDTLALLPLVSGG